MTGQQPPAGYDPNRFLADWQPVAEPREILCTCGCTLGLDGRTDSECTCGRIWNRFGRLIALVWPPKP